MATSMDAVGGPTDWLSQDVRLTSIEQVRIEDRAYLDELSRFFEAAMERLDAVEEQHRALVEQQRELAERQDLGDQALLALAEHVDDDHAATAAALATSTTELTRLGVDLTALAARLQVLDDNTTFSDRLVGSFERGVAALDEQRRTDHQSLEARVDRLARQVESLAASPMDEPTAEEQRLAMRVRMLELDVATAVSAVDEARSARTSSPDELDLRTDEADTEGVPPTRSRRWLRRGSA